MARTPARKGAGSSVAAGKVARKAAQGDQGRCSQTSASQPACEGQHVDHRARAVRPSAAPACAVSARCGACSQIDVPYDEQLAAKQQRIGELFAPFADPAVIRPIAGMAHPFHYRNKVASPFAPGRGKRKGAFAVDTGMYAKGTHRLVPTDGCLIEHEVGKRVVAAVRSLMLKWKIAPYDEDAYTGFMRHAVVRVGQESGEVLVTLVTNAELFPSSKSFCRELVRRVPEITTVVQNVNLRQTNAILGDAERVLYGPGFILDSLCGLSFRISSQSFYQVNAQQAAVLYEEAVAAARLDGSQTVIDAYCGTGTIGLVAAARGAARVIGVDSVEAAIRDARQNAAHNGIGNAEFRAEDATAFLTRMAAGGRAEAPLVLLMDPPRSGSTPAFLSAACQLGPERIVYISCNPATQARDARLLADGGYRIELIQPVDMFPHTDHIENIAAFVRA